MSGNKIFVDTNMLIYFLKGEPEVIETNRKIKDLTIEFRKKTKLKIPDSIVAASAYYMNLPLLTADKQMRTVDEIDVIIYEP